MKTRFLFLLLIFAFGTSQIHESFSEDYFSLPSCYIGTFEQDYVQCTTRDSPPCQEPSFEKNGYCAVHKIDICKAESILDDGKCIERDEFFGVGNPAYDRQSLQTGETLGNAPNTFGWFALALSAFIVFAYVVMKIKKRKKENE